jgi:hypothetical protein
VALVRVMIRAGVITVLTGVVLAASGVTARASAGCSYSTQRDGSYVTFCPGQQQGTQSAQGL